MNQAILSAGGMYFLLPAFKTPLRSFRPGIRPHGDQAGKTPFGLMQ